MKGYFTALVIIFKMMEKIRIYIYIDLGEDTKDEIDAEFSTRVSESQANGLSEQGA